MPDTTNQNLTEQVALRNGGKVERSKAMAVHLHLNILASRNQPAVYELYQLCTDPTHQVKPAFLLSTLQRAELVQANGTVSQVVRDVVLSSIELTSGVDFTLHHPLTPS